MKMFRLAAVLASLLVVSPAVAQWQTPNHSVPIGRGGGVTGFGAANPGTVGIPLVSSGLTLDPTFGQAQNVGIQPGAANTLKGSLDGASTVDIAAPTCTGVGQAWHWTAGSGPTCATITATTGFDYPVNLGLSASVAATSLTLNVTQASGAAPTASNPVVVPFRSTTAATGTVLTESITGSLSLTIPASATLGTSNSVPFRIWIFLNANGGTNPAIGVAVCSTATTSAVSLFPCAAWEHTLKTSVTISSGATSAGVLYAAAGVSNDAVRIIGFCDYSAGLTAAGSWISTCTTLQVMSPSIKKPGDIVQGPLVTTSTTQATTTSASFAALSGGTTQAITPTATMNPIRVTIAGTTSSPTGSAAAVQAVRGSTLIGVPFPINTTGTSGAGSNQYSTTMVTIDAPGSPIASQTYGYQGKTSTGTLAYPPSSTGVVVQLEEIQG